MRLDVSKAQCQKQLIPCSVTHGVNVQLFSSKAADPSQDSLITNIVDGERNEGTTCQRRKVISGQLQQWVLVCLAIQGHRLGKQRRAELLLQILTGKSVNPGSGG